MNPNQIKENYADKILRPAGAKVPQWIVESPEKDLELFNQFHGIDEAPKAVTLDQEAARLNRLSAEQLRMIRAIANLAG